jgi:RNA polymerase sigma factor (TIGR02999 family)
VGEKALDPDAKCRKIPSQGPEASRRASVDSSIDVVEPRIVSLIESAERGDQAAAKTLFAVLYSELRQLAKRELARRQPGVTLSPTTLLHEAYLDMSRRSGAAFQDRVRFMAYAARVMRGVLIDYVRRRQAQKRGGLFVLTSAGADVVEAVPDEQQLTRVSEAVDELAGVDPTLAELVDLKYFCGFSFAEIAAMRGVSERTVQRQWEKARIFLHRAIRHSDVPV